MQAQPGPRLWSRLARTSLRGGCAPSPCVRPRRAGPAVWRGGDALAASGCGLAAPLGVPPRRPCGCRRASRCIPLFISAPTVSMAGFVGAASFPSCVACWAVGWPLLPWGGGGGGGSRRLLASPTGPPPALWWSRTRRPRPVLPPHTPPAAPVGRCAPPELVPWWHGQWHKSRASRAGTRHVNCCDTDIVRHVLAWALPSAPGGNDGASVCLLALGQPSTLGRPRRAGSGARRAPFFAGHPRPQGARSGPLMVRRPRGLGRGVPVKRERRVAWGGGGRCCPGGRGHGPAEWHSPACPSGRVAPGLCAAPEIPAQGGRGARPRAAPTCTPLGARSGPPGGGGGGAGGRGRRGGGGRLAEEVPIVLVGVELHTQIEVTCSGLGTVALRWLIPRGRLLHGEEGPQGREEAGWRRACRERQQGPVAERLEGEAREHCPAGCGRGQDHL